VNAVVTGSLSTLTRLWRGDVSWPETLRNGAVVVSADSLVRRQVPEWIGQARLAATPRVEAG
jgi:hypothetical protein